MQETQPSIFDKEMDEFVIPRRNTLLPWWIKAFNWAFMIFGGLTVLSLLLRLANFRGDLSIYGLTTNELFSPVGLTIFGVFLFKGIAAYGLWSEKSWAVNVAMADAVIGFIICIYTMIFMASSPTKSGNVLLFNFRFELVLLFLYLRKLLKIREDWNNYSGR